MLVTFFSDCSVIGKIAKLVSMSFAEVGRCRSAGVDIAVSADGSSDSDAAAAAAGGGAAAAAAGGGAAAAGGGAAGAAAAGAAESKGLSMGSSGCGPI